MHPLLLFLLVMLLCARHESINLFFIGIYRCFVLDVVRSLGMILELNIHFLFNLLWPRRKDLLTFDFFLDSLAGARRLLKVNVICGSVLGNWHLLSEFWLLSSLLATQIKIVHLLNE